MKPVRERLNQFQAHSFQDATTSPTLPDIATIEAKSEQLNTVERELIAEFAGLDRQIRQIMKSVRHWWLIPQAQRRPTIISLWGMTGVGKSTFVQALAQKLGITSRFALHDLGQIASEAGSTHPSWLIPDDFLRLSSQPAILFLDEFHKIRSIDENGSAIERSAFGPFWTLMDSGKIPAIRRELRNALLSLRTTLKESREAPEPLGRRYHDTYLYEQTVHLLGLNADMDELQRIADENPQAFLEWLIEKVEGHLANARTYDFTQSLIFVAGNLDEAFTDAGMVNPDDMNAEDLYKRTSSVSVDAIKKCLLHRFLPEQVARLGSNHVIFPSMSRAAFEKMISTRLATTSGWLKNAFQIELSFDPSVVTLIFQEGAIASQGARPVISTMSELIDTRVPEWLVAAATEKTSKVTAKFNFDTSTLSLLNGPREIWTEKIVRRDERLPKLEIPDWMKELVAAHEAGHAVVGIVNEGRLPIKVLAGSLAWHRGGPRVIFSGVANITREYGVQMLELMLAGAAGERMAFGKNHLSSGASEDLRTATELASSMITKFGMGPHKGVSVNDMQFPPSLVSFKEKDDRECEWLISSSWDRALEIIESQRGLFQAIRSALLTAERLTSPDLKAIVTKHYKGSKREVAAILERKDPKVLEALVKPKIRKAA